MYLLIQKCVYNIDTKYDVVPPYLHYFHNITNYFKCPFQNCERVYHTKYPLKQHLSVYHGYVLEKNNVEGQPCNASTNVNKETAHSFESTAHINEDNIESFGLLKFKLELDKLILSFLSQLYSISSLPRSLIQTIVQLVNNLLTSAPFLILKKTLSSISEECSLMFSLLQSSITLELITRE